MNTELTPIVKSAKTEDEAKKMHVPYDSKIPHGSLQWKGSDVCMDWYCKCGNHNHIDSDFTYHVKCEECGTIYSCDPHIAFIEVTNPDEENMIIR